ncbi:MAG: hypothetical protein HXX15_06210 [Rhodopseudomonas sp.]|uniref:hypothetical protein n=1 Tax=Rhodopseudomonas sp. TaxID=1078 RepID=UPI001853E136|nr:hypothetical protein [Rhodopseudomonas sp.]NVN85667.1 hypothetical protein [Rhodopseudomonas sp.]
MNGRSNLTRRFGVGAALAAAIAAIGYDIPQILQVIGVLSDPWDRILIFAPSLALASAFVLTIAAAHAATPQELRAWSLSALALAILYAADVSLVYVVQLGVVIPHDLRGEGHETAFAACCAPGMPTTAIDLLGYTYMSASSLLLAPAFPGNGVRRWLRYALIVNGLFAPMILGQLAWPWLVYAVAPWIVSFPASMLLLAMVLRLPPQHDQLTRPHSLPANSPG